MSIQFCTTCNNILILQDNFLFCKTCNTKIPTTQTSQIIETQQSTQPKIGSGVAKPLSSGHNFKCKRCNNTKAKLTDLGCMIGDEDWIYLLECTKCGWGTRVGSWC